MPTKKIHVIQNTLRDETPTIRITELDPEWEKAHNDWIFGKNPTNSPEWKKGVISFWETIEVKEPSLWNTDYWHVGHNVYDFFMKKYECSKCKKERTAALCKTCIFNTSKAEEERSKVIDVLAPTVAEEVLKKDHSEITPEMYKALSDAYGAMNHTLTQIDKLFAIMQEAARSHGGSLHDSKGCSKCLEDKRVWLETNHPDWRTKSNEKGCCTLCIERAHEALSNSPKVETKTVPEKAPAPKKIKDAPKAVTL